MPSNLTKKKQTVSSDVGMKVVEVLKDKALSKQVALTRELKLTIVKSTFVSVFVRMAQDVWPTAAECEMDSSMIGKEMMNGTSYCGQFQ